MIVIPDQTESTGGERQPSLSAMLNSAEAEIAILVEEGSRLIEGVEGEIVRAFERCPDATALFGDELLIDRATGRGHPVFRPGWSPELFATTYYPGPVIALRRSVAAELEFDEGRGNVPSLYKVLLQLSEKAGSVVHIPVALAETDSALAEKRLAGRHDSMMNTAGEWLSAREDSWTGVERGRITGSWRHRRAVPDNTGLSIIIPTRDRVEYLAKCIDSIYANIYPFEPEIVVVDNNSREEETKAYLGNLESSHRAMVLRFPEKFNFSAMCNRAAEKARGDLLLFLNNDTEIIVEDSLLALAEEANRVDAGPVGALLLYPDNTIQHAGVVAGLGGEAGHMLKGLKQSGVAHFVSPLLLREVTAVTAACMMIRKDRFLELGMFNEKNLPVSFNDVDLCLRSWERGYRVIYTPHAVFCHHETISRPREVSPREIRFMEKRWGAKIKSDPFYHPALAWQDEQVRIDPNAF